MKNYVSCLVLISFLYLKGHVHAQSENVNVFLGSSGDHGQLSPAASSPFHQLSIVPQTNPTLHMGYEYLAKEVVGFTHNRFEGVGCKGSGGLILVKPFLGDKDTKIPLQKRREKASPGSYEIEFKEGIGAKIAVDGNFGIHEYTFPKGKKGLSIDLAHAFNGAFVNNKYEIKDGLILGALRAKTTCNVGIYTIYYAISLNHVVDMAVEGDKLRMHLANNVEKSEFRIAFSAVDIAYARKTLEDHNTMDYARLKQKSVANWDRYLSAIQVEGDPEREKLFYSLFYRTMQSPYKISEADGKYRGTDGEIHQDELPRFHGWAIWDNYKTQLPLLELAFPQYYQAIVSSISDLYRYGKHDFAGRYEPANSVRTEHAAVVLLDAKGKGYEIHLDEIRDSLIKDTSRFDFSKPDKYLEAAYDMWTMSQLFEGEESDHYFNRAMTYKKVWEKHFKDLKRNDVDRMSARDMYQGTIRQYRWNVPFDVLGLVKLAEGKTAFTEQLDDFFDNHYFNRANEPDMQSPTLYYSSAKPWRYQSLVHELALDTVIQYYFNDNSRGIDAHIDRIYKNEPKAFVRTMDDDAGAMSGWFVMTAIGLHQPLIGEPIYYLNVPFFSKVTLANNGKPLVIKVLNFSDRNRYIKSVKLNGKDLGRVWIKHEELAAGGELVIEASNQSTTYGFDSIWISNANIKEGV
ncbi:glycoside hydrolase family 92 protein [Sphingobacterium alkalisoli]|uniref:Glycoside hydrolase family 92 protein n=1 Tax=Sphingobacterium alkalisoli TaxID=1874115 RepID=A0A4U0HC72_9SPHI|nr:glycoside hydrolase domain-containing protein [Sphingobacterium alkalisoli]TJY68222.1 glycoside hydrolase family 92 protein [Sphingobacterium alkalisoli]GGH08085.1 alpha-1,2-mannosidase [Sphingobacterium alkalisoli]